MKHLEGNIWHLHDFGYPIVVPTNIGWKANGNAVFGRGIASECAKRFPESVSRWGALCQTFEDKTTTFYDEKFNLFYMPVKPLNREAPHMSWKSDAQVELIKHSLASFIILVDQNKLKQVVTPLVGCGNGGLAPKDIKPLMEKNLDDRFFLIRPCFASYASSPKTSAPSKTSSWTSPSWASSAF